MTEADLMKYVIEIMISTAAVGLMEQLLFFPLMLMMLIIISMAVASSPLLLIHDDDAAPAVLVGSSDESRFVPPHSNANSMIYTGPSSCHRITGLSVAVLTSTDLQSDRGFSIQLNGYSPPGYTAAWQQYGFTVDASGVNVFAENWKLPVVGTDDLFNVRPSLFQLVSPPSVPANYLFNISLLYDGGDDVVGAQYSVYDQASSSTVGSLSLMLRDIVGFDPTWYAPLVAFQMNIVGPYNSLGTTFSDPASGIIYYSAAANSYLTTIASEPSSSCVAAPNIITAETSNLRYSDLPGQYNATAFSQAFFIQ